MKDLNCTHCQTFVAQQPVITRKSLLHQSDHQSQHFMFLPTPHQPLIKLTIQLIHRSLLTLGPGKPRMPFSPLTPGRESKPWNHNQKCSLLSFDHKPIQSGFHQNNWCKSDIEAYWQARRPTDAFNTLRTLENRNRKDETPKLERHRNLRFEPVGFNKSNIRINTLKKNKKKPSKNKSSWIPSIWRKPGSI